MTGDLPSSTPEKIGDNKATANGTDNQRKADPKEKIKPRKRKAKKWFGLTEAKWRELLAIVMLIPWVWVDLIDSHNFTKLSLLAICLAVAQGVAFSFFRPRWRGVMLALWLISLVPVAGVVWENSRPEPKPHFTLSLQTRDLPEAIVALTNECLFRPGMVNVITNPSNGSLFFKGIVSGCIVIPVRDGESNAVFRFIAENDSSVNVNDLVISAGFPDFGKIGLDSTKWHEVREHMTVPGWRLQITNMQFWAARIPWPLVAGDSITFPEITNFSIPEWDSSSNNLGLFKLLIRSTGFEQQLGANLFFIRVPTNVMFKPFVTEMRLGKDGLWRADLSSNGLENLQK